MYVWILFNNKHDRFTTCFKNLWNKILGFFCTFKSDNKAYLEKILEKSPIQLFTIYPNRQVQKLYK